MRVRFQTRARASVARWLLLVFVVVGSTPTKVIFVNNFHFSVLFRFFGAQNLNFL